MDSHGSTTLCRHVLRPVHSVVYCLSKMARHCVEEINAKLFSVSGAATVLVVLVK